MQIKDIQPQGVFKDTYVFEAKQVSNHDVVYFTNKAITTLNKQEAIDFIRQLLEKHDLIEINTELDKDTYIVYVEESPVVPFADLPF